MHSETPVCTKCGQTKPIDEYAWRDKAKGTRRRNCKTCGEVVKSAWAKARRQRERENKQAQKDSETHRPCSLCKQTKPIDEFPWKKEHEYRRRQCKLCFNAKQSARGKRRYQKDKDAYKRRHAHWEQVNKAHRKSKKHA